jgi:spoIIIJ-associated protein
MIRIEAKTLEEAYVKAARELDCSVGELEYEIIQHPTGGFLGIGSKPAVIVADCPRRTSAPSRAAVAPTPEPIETHTDRNVRTPEEETIKTASDAPEADPEYPNRSDRTEETILDNFFNEETHQSDAHLDAIPVNESELGPKLEAQVRQLIDATCFDIDTVEVDVIDGTSYIFIDGEDAALLIGKEGYRYNALSYLLYNWIHNTYGLYVKLEIAQFLASQQEMIRHHLQPVVEHVRQQGWGKTRPLDGILVHIALEQLREEFPDKYVAIKRTREGERYVLINEFNKRT